MTDMIIRRAGAQDAAILAQVSATTFTQTFQHLYSAPDLQAFLAQNYTPAAIGALLADPAYAAWLAVLDGKVIGHALAGPCGLPHPDVTPTCGELKRVYILKAWQGGGRGSRLLDECLAWLEKDGPRTLWIGVWSLNLGAQKLYESRGFHKAGEYGFPVGETIDHEFILRKG